MLRTVGRRSEPRRGEEFRRLAPVRFRSGGATGKPVPNGFEHTSEGTNERRSGSHRR